MTHRQLANQVILECARTVLWLARALAVFGLTMGVLAAVGVV